MHKLSLTVVFVASAILVGVVAGLRWPNDPEPRVRISDSKAVGADVQLVQSDDAESVPYEEMCRACWLPNGSIYCGRSCDATGRTLYTPPGESLQKCGFCGDNRKWKK